MSEPSIQSEQVMTHDSIRTALARVGLTPHEFIQLVTRSLMDDYEAIEQLIEAIKSLRVQNAHTQRNPKLLNSPSPIELEYRLSLQSLTRAHNSRRSHKLKLMSEALTDVDQATSVRFAAMNYLASERTPWETDRPLRLKDNSPAYEPILAILEGRFNLLIFELCVHAMHEPFLSASDQSRARQLASKMMHMCDRSEFDFDPESMQDRHIHEPDEVLFERFINEKYGEGTFETLLYETGR